MQIAVIGVGVMGSAIAGRLLDSGATLHLYDRDSTQMAPMIARGATAAGSASEATAHADHVIISLNSAAIVEQAVFGPDGVVQAADAGKLLIDMSSIDAGRTAVLAQRLREDTGMGWVDAPLSGGAPAAAQGKLTLMVGGSAEDFALSLIHI